MTLQKEKAGKSTYWKPKRSYWSLYNVIHKRLLRRMHELARSTSFSKSLLDPSSTDTFPKNTEMRPLTPNEIFWRGWFDRFTEIHHSIERLAQSLAYLANYPRNRKYKNLGLTEACWLRYHVEAYVEEQYILVCRIRTFLRRLERVARQAGDTAAMQNAQSLLIQVESGFRSAINTRSHHVHESRFHDDKLRQLDTWVLVADQGRSAELNWARLLVYLQAHKKWKETLSNNNRNLESFCIRIFKDTKRVLIRHEPKH